MRVYPAAVTAHVVIIMGIRERDDSPYHAGEQAIQTRAGQREISEQMGRKMIRPALPDQHRAFFEQLPFVLVGSLDDAGQPWASMLVGRSGFIHSPDAHTLAIGAAVHPADPLHAALRVGAPLGLLGIQLETRRRNRANGHVSALDARGFRLHVDQSFGNCPRYISARTFRWRAGQQPVAAGAVEGQQLSAAARANIRAADTCFIASASSRDANLGDAREGVDVSHRGGRPGFIYVDDSAPTTRLIMPDFAGNNAFNTLGNLARYPSAGLLFPDFASGDLLALGCDAEIVWEGSELERFRGAERLIQFHVRGGSWLRGYMPFEWSAPQPGPHTERTGQWSGNE